jgi:hypothetical protein
MDYASLNVDLLRIFRKVCRKIARERKKLMEDETRKYAVAKKWKHYADRLESRCVPDPYVPSEIVWGKLPEIAEVIRLAH